MFGIRRKNDRREELLERIDREFAETARLTGRKEIQPAVRAALARVPRERFVPADLQECAYHNTALPIGLGQTISQPFIVALMTDLLDIRPGSVVLEVGTGSGYQAAVLAELGARVYSLEIVDKLAEAARTRLAELGYGGVTVRAGDGWSGWPEHGPYDGILVTAVSPEVPPPLVEQLAPGGVLVVPIGRSSYEQQLTVVTKSEAGEVSTREVLPVVFVPLTGEHDQP